MTNVDTVVNVLPTRIQSNRGYAILKSSLTMAEIAMLKRELLVQQITHPDFPPMKPFGVWEETDRYIRLPVAWATQRFGPAEVVLVQDIPRPNISFVGSLRPHQIEPVEMAVTILREQGRGILCLVTGGGKTVSSLNIACQLGVKTLVLVHKRSLLEQWKDEISKVVPTARVGIFCQKQCEYGDEYDITLGMWQTILNRKAIPNVFSLTIVDECHRVSSKEFSQAMFKVNARYVLGLSATPQRADGLTCVLNWHLGDLIYRQDAIRRSSARTLVWMCRYTDPEFAMVRVTGKNYSGLINKLCASERRNEYIIGAIRLVLERPDANQRRILVLTDRVAHAKELVLRLRALVDGKRSIGLFIGQVKLADLVEAKKCDVIVATYKIFEEGESVEDLNVLVLASPKREITQALGRIFRKQHVISPIVIDISDMILSGQMRARMNIYRDETNQHLTFQFLDANLRPTGKAAKEIVAEQDVVEDIPVGLNWNLEDDDE